MKAPKDYSDYLNDIIHYARKAEIFSFSPIHDYLREGYDAGPQSR